MTMNKSATNSPRYWIGEVGELDDFGVQLTDEFIDGMTAMGPWAIMSLGSWRLHGSPRLGTGWGQRYKRQADGRWLKVEG
jgi:hypothetical protein